MNIGCTLLLLFAFACSPGKCSAADITWKVYLKRSPNPVFFTVTREGEELVFPRISLSGAESGSQNIVDALVNTRFLVSRLPVSRPTEFRITLNTSGSRFETAQQKTVFLNMTVNAYIDGRIEEPFRFSVGSPMEFSIPVEGFTYLLSLCGFSRSDDITLAYATGSGFTRDGIVTENSTSGLQAKITHLSTIVGSRCDILNLPPSKSIKPWHQIKIMFK
ncbi:MAG: hypothetical protein ACYC9O_03070 [Candidatus Latescibacterota bacterium]